MMGTYLGFGGDAWEVSKVGGEVETLCVDEWRTERGLMRRGSGEMRCRDSMVLEVGVCLGEGFLFSREYFPWVRLESGGFGVSVFFV